MTNVLFDGTVANTETLYVRVPVHGDAIGLHIGWRDAVSAANITLELSSSPDAPALAEGDAWEWVDSGETISGPSATAAGAELLHLENVRQRLARLKIEATADCDLVIYDGAVTD